MIEAIMCNILRNVGNKQTDKQTKATKNTCSPSWPIAAEIDAESITSFAKEVVSKRKQGWTSMN